VSADLLGTVFIYTDYRVPVEGIRKELHRILQNSEKWDGRVWNLQATNSTERAVELRALMSAADSSQAWDLRCEVREKLIDFIQREYPESLPHVRFTETAQALQGPQLFPKDSSNLNPESKESG
jgi:hypothetical protein